MGNTERTTIILVRHTDVHNPQDILYGRLPRFRLSDLGWRQAEVTASALAEASIVVFYTSPRLRARQTARILAGPHLGVPVRVTRLLDEVKTGWQGKPHSDLEAITFNFYDQPVHPTDETIQQVGARVTRFVGLARRRHPGQIVVGVTHGDPVIIARAGYLGKPLTVESLRRPNFYPGKGSLTRFTFSPNLRDTSPLSVDYYDPNGEDSAMSAGWVGLKG